VFKNSIHTLEDAKAALEDNVRVNYIVCIVVDFEKCGPLLRSCFGKIKPAATIISANLANDKMKIGVTALKKKGKYEKKRLNLYASVF
jgi:hypothetical protein